jgi:hypothetical protein
MRHNLCRITRERMLAGCCLVVSEQRASPHVGHSLWCLVNLAGRIECGVAIAAQNVVAITARGGGQRVGRNQALRTLVGAAAAGHAFNRAHSEFVDVKLQQQVVVSADSYELASEPRLYIHRGQPNRHASHQMQPQRSQYLPSSCCSCPESAAIVNQLK